MSAAPGERRTRPAALVTPVESEGRPTEATWEADAGDCACKSTLTELLPPCTGWCSSPATTSTCRGGRTARLAAAGPDVAAEFVPAGNAAGGVCGFAFIWVAATGWVAVLAAPGCVLEAGTAFSI